MTLKTSVSLTDAQGAFARDLVARGHYPSLSAVLQRGVELLREEAEAREADMEALRELLIERLEGPFVSEEAFRARTRARMEELRAELGLAD